MWPFIGTADFVPGWGSWRAATISAHSASSRIRAAGSEAVCPMISCARSWISANGGYQEITLLGQTVNSYGMKLDPPVSFAALLRRIDRAVGRSVRVRFTTSHPKDVTAELADAMATLPSVCPHMHLPVQSGSTRTLARMERTYTREEYLDKVRLLKTAVPDLSLTTDIIVGFPGESDADFVETLTLMREAAFDAAFAFKFSPRAGTPAADFSDQVSDSLRASRLSSVLSLQDDLSLQTKHGLDRAPCRSPGGSGVEQTRLRPGRGTNAAEQDRSFRWRRGPGGRTGKCRDYGSHTASFEGTPYSFVVTPQKYVDIRSRRLYDTARITQEDLWRLSTSASKTLRTKGFHRNQLKEKQKSELCPSQMARGVGCGDRLSLPWPDSS